MAVVEVTTGVSLEQYLAVKQRVSETHGPVAGRLLQVCSGDADDLLIITVYESTEDYEAFAGTVLAPILVALDYTDIDYESHILPVHDMTGGGPG